MDLNELTYQINGAAFEVSSILGPGFLEKVYESGNKTDGFRSIRRSFNRRLQVDNYKNQVQCCVRFEEI